VEAQTGEFASIAIHPRKFAYNFFRVRSWVLLLVMPFARVVLTPPSSNTSSCIGPGGSSRRGHPQKRAARRRHKLMSGPSSQIACKPSSAGAGVRVKVESFEVAYPRPPKSMARAKRREASKNFCEIYEMSVVARARNR
jgi:hypothetical protein